MSSSAEGGAVIAGAVLAPLTLTYAAGWLLVQGGNWSCEKRHNKRKTHTRGILWDLPGV